MGDAIYDLLFQGDELDSSLNPPSNNAATRNYLSRLSTLSVSALTGTEQESLSHDSQSILRSLQALSKRSSRSINDSVDALSYLPKNLPDVLKNTDKLQNALPGLEQDASSFAEKYSKMAENPALDRRKRAMRLSDNVDRLSDMLELPSLLVSTIAASAGSAAGPTAGQMSSANANYVTALDLYSYIKRLERLYPASELIKSISMQAEDAMRTMTSNLIAALRAQSLKLAAGMRLVGLLRRVAPELDEEHDKHGNWVSSGGEGALGYLFILCRLTNFTTTLDALEPLKELADQETEQRQRHKVGVSDKDSWSSGQQTERYLKRYIEIIREQCFGILSMYKSIFPSSLPQPGGDASQLESDSTPALSVKAKNVNRAEPAFDDPIQQLPPALATFAFHIIDILYDTLKDYMPNVADQGSRDSLFTQVLYCAASLGRLGADFGMILSLLEEEADVLFADSPPETDTADPEWVEVMKKHRVQAGRLGLLASGVGVSKSNKESALPA